MRNEILDQELGCLASSFIYVSQSGTCSRKAEEGSLKVPHCQPSGNHPLSHAPARCTDQGSPVSHTSPGPFPELCVLFGISFVREEGFNVSAGSSLVIQSTIFPVLAFFHKWTRHFVPTHRIEIADLQSKSGSDPRHTSSPQSPSLSANNSGSSRRPSARFRNSASKRSKNGRAKRWA